jgi:glycosyltransferase involved in cell wall biosynthesis
MPELSIVTPAHNEEANLPLLYQALCEHLADYDWEWILVDDHSSDSTLSVFSRLAANDARLKGLRFSRNFGSHKALICGLREARGQAAVILAADLQDPPQVIPRLYEAWKAGDQVVWAVRKGRPGEKQSSLAFGRLYYWIMRRFVGLTNMPATGADFFLADRRVLDALAQFRENNVSLFALIGSLGFRHGYIDYVKEARQHGTSSWTFAKKFKLVLDSVIAFTYLPIRYIMAFGSLVGLGGFLYSLFVVYNYVHGSPSQGWSSLMVVVLMLGGMQMMMLGVLGEYIWRTLDESRARPLYLVEQVVVGGGGQEVQTSGETLTPEDGQN